MEFKDIAEKLNITTKFAEKTYAADCPSCKKKGTLTVHFDTEEGKTRLICNNGCTEKKICHSLQIRHNDLYAESTAPYSICFKNLDEFEEREPKWLFKNWLPEGQIALLAADGGVGKTTLWCNLAAAVSSGKPCILDNDDVIREPQKVLIFTTEDSISHRLKKKLRLAGANLNNIKALDLQQDRTGTALYDLTFGSPALSGVIKVFRPALCIFDPVQSFVAPDVNMGSRNAMRTALAPLIPLGEECGTTFLIICHSNKRKGAAARDRIADSADLWDISRSVLMAGYTQEKGVRYLSNEKNNYAVPPPTVLFGIDNNGLIEKRGTTEKRDRDFMIDAMNISGKPYNQRDDCKQFVLDTLSACEDARLSSAELKQLAKDEGYSPITLRRAKDELKESGEIIIGKEGGKGGTWYIELNNFCEELPKWEQTPFDFSETN